MHELGRRVSVVCDQPRQTRDGPPVEPPQLLEQGREEGRRRSGIGKGTMACRARLSEPEAEGLETVVPQPGSAIRASSTVS